MTRKLPTWARASYYNKVLANPDDYTITIFDTETTNKQKGTATDPSNDIVLACWITFKGGKEIDRGAEFGDEYNQKRFVRRLLESDLIVAHNAKFDLQWAKRCGVDLRKVKPYCTAMGEWVLLANRGTMQDLGLNASAKRYGLGTKDSLVSALIKSGVCPSEIPRDWLLKYCFEDVLLCYDVFRLQSLELLARGMVHIVHNRSLTSCCLADVEFAGMTLDAPAVMEEYEKAMQILEESYKKLQALAPGVNFNSPKQLSAFMYDTLGFTPIREKEQGKWVEVRSTNAKVMAQLEAKTPEQKEFIQAYKTYNKYDSLVSKNLEFFKRVCEERSCRFLAVYNQGATDTHRLSSSGRPLIFKDEKKARSVQFQNIPRAYKRLFWSGDDEYYVGEADAAQLEFRVAAALGNDDIAIKEIIDGADVHSITAQVLTEAGEPTDRQGAKASTFAPLYGGMGSTPAQKEYAAFFKDKYKGISSTQRGWALEVLSNKELVLPYGMRYYWPDTKLVAKTGYITNSTQIYNFPVITAA